MYKKNMKKGAAESRSRLENPAEFKN